MEQSKLVKQHTQMLQGAGLRQATGKGNDKLEYEKRRREARGGGGAEEAVLALAYVTVTPPPPLHYSSHDCSGPVL